MPKYLGIWNPETYEVDNPRFKFLTKGSEHIVYDDGDSVLKVYIDDITYSKERLLELANYMIENRNSVSEQIPISLEGYVVRSTNKALMYVVFKQEKIEPIKDINTYDTLIGDLRKRLQNNGWEQNKENGFYNKDLDKFLEDVSPKNVGLKDGKLYIIDGCVNE